MPETTGTSSISTSLTGANVGANRASLLRLRGGNDVPCGRFGLTGTPPPLTLFNPVILLPTPPFLLLLLVRLRPGVDTVPPIRRLRWNLGLCEKPDLAPLAPCWSLKSITPPASERDNMSTLRFCSMITDCLVLATVDDTAPLPPT